MDMYRSRALEGASGVELTIALYDGIIRFMHDAIDAVERNDAEQRRAAVKRAMDIVIHLQATLNRDMGGEAGEGARRVLCGDVCADAARFAGELGEEIRASDCERAKCAGCLEASGSRPQRESVTGRLRRQLRRGQASKLQRVGSTS